MANISGALKQDLRSYHETRMNNMSVSGIERLLTNHINRDVKWNDFHEVDVAVHESHAMVRIVLKPDKLTDRSGRPHMTNVVQEKLIWNPTYIERKLGASFIVRIEKAKLKMQKIADKKNYLNEYVKQIQEIV